MVRPYRQCPREPLAFTLLAQELSGGAMGTHVAMISLKVWLLCFKLPSWPQNAFFPEVIMVLGAYRTTWPSVCNEN